MSVSVRGGWREEGGGKRERGVKGKIRSRLEGGREGRRWKKVEIEKDEIKESGKRKRRNG